MSLIILVLLLVLWLACIIIGFTIKALLWLAIVGLVLFMVTAVGGMIRHANTPPR